MNKLINFLFLILLSFSLKSQTIDREPKERYFVPNFNDTTSLFHADSLVWKCHYKNDSPKRYRSLNNVSFERVDTCKCYYEKYLKIKKHTYWESHYKISLQHNYASLVRQYPDTTKFLYTEAPAYIKNAKIKLYEFKMDSILGTDTMWIENEFGDLKNEVMHYFYTK